MKNRCIFIFFNFLSSSLYAQENRLKGIEDFYSYLVIRGCFVLLFLILLLIYFYKRVIKKQTSENLPIFLLIYFLIIVIWFTSLFMS